MGWDYHFLGVRNVHRKIPALFNLQHYFHVNKIPSLAAGIIENPVLQPVAALSV
jgi:hypothetical protein